MKILIAGPIGSGKTTQAQILSKHLHLPLIKTGDLVRNKIKGKNEEAEILRHYAMAGHLIPDHIMADLFKEEVKRKKIKDYISDSYPRRISQLKVFDPQIDQVIYLDIPDEELERRLLMRHREDDSPDVIEKRLHVYHRETVPVLEHYKKEGKLHNINGVGLIEEITRRIKEEIKAKFKDVIYT